MKLTAKSQYALVALNHMRRQENVKVPIRLADISEKEGISLHFLEQIFRKLRNAKLVTSCRGPGGGYLLTGNKISYNDVFKALGEGIETADTIDKKAAKSFAKQEVWESLESMKTKIEEVWMDCSLPLF
jgi:Rrf2 family iron-sulfur cluster assembly transcriptional regulator